MPSSQGEVSIKPKLTVVDEMVLSITDDIVIEGDKEIDESEAPFLFDGHKGFDEIEEPFWYDEGKMCVFNFKNLSLY